MADQDWTTSHPLIADVLDRATDYSFFQVVSLVERVCRPQALVGGEGPADREVLRFRPELSMAFPVSDVARFEQTRSDPPRFRLTTTFFGLYGTTSPLPPFYTEDLMAEQEGEEPVRCFLDLFHHRLLSLLYRCWVKYRYHVQFDPSGKDPFSQRMFALLGVGTEEAARRTGSSPTRLLRYAGLLNQRPRSASALEGLLSDFFDDVDVHVEQCTGRWVPIPSEQQAVLGRSNCALGQDCTLGQKLLSRQSSFCVALGPMDHGRFIRLLPGSSDIRTLSALIELFVEDRFDVDLELLLRGDEIPVLRLTARDDDGARPRLGQTSWLPAGAGNGSPRRVVFQLDPTETAAERWLSVASKGAES